MNLSEALMDPGTYAFSPLSANPGFSPNNLYNGLPKLNLLLCFLAMSQPIETLFVDTPKVSCDGDPTSGHPRVFLTMGADHSVDCPYCGRHFVLKDGALSSNAH